ncbi:hypothetical protein ACIQ34_10390 [Ureibacillus sp. NPDC094379]
MKNHSKQSNVGSTIFKPTGVRQEFSHVDLVNEQVICKVVCEEKTVMTVTVDVKTNGVKIDGSVDQLGELSMDRDSWVDLFKEQAKFFIENKISNPDEYYDELIKNQS